MLMTATMRGTEDAAEVAEAARWRAVLDRDRRGDGRFVFAVRTTGVYCRPSCPARRPRRENVAFFALPEAAEQAGFRSCRRCRPRDVGAADPRAAMVRRACRLLEDGERAEPWRLPELAEAVGVSARHLLRTFKDALGVTPREYAEARRLALFKGRLRKGDSVTGALYDVGFGSSSRLYEDAQGRLGMTPATYRRGGRGMRIGYTIADSPLGRLLVGATERGVAAVSLGDDDAVLETALRTEYPHAEITRDDTGLRTWVARVLAEVAGAERRSDQTRSYSEIARRLGQPTAARAVARACASNRVALVVPCHRVVEAGGGLGGYRWGVEKKRALLAREQQEPAVKTSSARGRRS